MTNNKKRSMPIQKGMLLGCTGWWYVVVEAFWKKGVLTFHCICDNANNIYSFDAGQVDCFLTTTEVGNSNWTGGREEVPQDYVRREIPWDVVTEVLTGRHDTRFDHWHKESP